MADTPVQTSPFEQPQSQSPFGADVQADTQAQPNDNVATPNRTATMALALLNKQQSDTRDDIATTLDKNIALSKQLIESGQEQVTRLQAVVEGTKDRMAGLSQAVGTDLGGGQMLTPEIVSHVQQTTAADRANRIDDLSASALEEQAIHAIQDKLAAGDTVGARALYNRMDPSKSTSYGALKDFYTTDMMIGNAVEKAGFDQNEESVWHKVLTTIAVLPESFLLKGMRSQLGNVDTKTGGYEPSWFKFLDPSGELDKQVLAWQSMPTDQRAKYLPTLLDHIKSNSTSFGLYDPGKAQELLSSFKTGVSDWQRVVGDASSAADLVLLAPLLKGTGTALTHGTDIITGMGARSAAANRVANAFEIGSKEGIAAMVQKTAIVPDELVEKGLPSQINPLLTPERKITKGTLLSGAAKINTEFAPKIEAVSHAGDVADQVAYAHEVLDSPELKLITAPNRFFSPEEREIAIKNTLDTIKARTTSNVLDYTAEDVRQVNGQVVTQLDVTLNKPFASEDEARLWLHHQGYGADVTNVVKKEGEKVSPEVIQLTHSGADGVFTLEKSKDDEWLLKNSSGEIQTGYAGDKQDVLDHLVDHQGFDVVSPKADKVGGPQHDVVETLQDNSSLVSRCTCVRLASTPMKLILRSSTSLLVGLVVTPLPLMLSSLLRVHRLVRFSSSGCGSLRR
jgi:hypothetical protein